MKKLKIYHLLFVLELFFFISCGDQKPQESQETTQDQALEALNKKIKSNPDDAALYLQKGEYLLNHGSISESLMNFLLAVDLDSTNVKAWSRLADIYMLMDNYIEAENAMIQTLKLDPDNEENLLKLAKYYIVFFNYEDARKYLDQILAKNNLNAQAYCLYGNYYLEQGDTSKAVSSFNQSLELDDNIYDSYIALALLYELRNNPVAIDYYQNAIRVRPNNLQAQYKLAYYLQEKSGKIDEAMKMYEAILEKDPTFFYALYNIGYVYLIYKQDPRTALDYFSRAAEFSNKKDPDVLYNMAYCMELMGNKKEARRIYKEILEVFHDHELTIKAQRRVGRFE